MSGAAVPETSYYPALANLLDEVGRSLKPRVRCILQLANLGAGLPDGGLFTVSQFQRPSDEDPIPGQLPERGVIEIKPPSNDAWVTADSHQVSTYWDRYGLVLVTNYRDFLLLGRDSAGQPAKLESYRLARNVSEFRTLTAHPRKAVSIHGEPFVEYLKRVMLQAAPLSSPADVAWFLASYARDARSRVTAADDLPALAAIRQALEESLGIRFEGKRGDHFFRSTLVQTLFYGIFSAWVLWAKQASAATRFDWRTAAWSLRVPMLKALFEQVAMPSRLGPLGLLAVLDWAAEALNRVDRSTFFTRFEEAHAVQYFYEPFLEAFDPDLRKELGVWYTPPEVVRYMVARVDAALREELGLADGLADPKVFVLDPCCGTGTYLVEVLRRIAETHEAKGADALLAADIKRAARDRVFGFEILPAPFVVAHLQLGLLLQHLGAPLSELKAERASVFLTNALTGWAPPTEAGKQRVSQLALAFPELAEERDAANEVKRDRPILVILGNPPYNGFAGLAVDEERDLTTAYRTTVRAPAPQGQGLNDLYVRFFRMAERKIVDGTRKGAVCFISNASWLDGLSFSGMRERYLDAFDRIWIDNLNGDKYKTGKTTPEGKADPSVFSTEWNREGIQVGTAIALLIRVEQHAPTPTVRFRDFWGTTKREQLLTALKRPDDFPHRDLTPGVDLGFPFLPAATTSAYFSWPPLPALLPVSFPGVKTSRDDLVVDIDRDRLVKRLCDYFAPDVSHEEIRGRYPSALESTARFDGEQVRDILRHRGFLPEHVVPYYYRPFDLRWIYWEPETDLLDRKRADYRQHVFPGNLWLTAGQRNRKADFYQPQVTTVLADHHVVESNVGMFPLLLKTGDERPLFEGRRASAELNLSEGAKSYLETIGRRDDDLFFHAIAVLHSPQYRTENAGALRQDWPRVPLPATADLLAASADLARTIAALFDTEAEVRGVTAGTIRKELRRIAVFCTVAGHTLQLDSDLQVTAGWGHRGNGGVVMPGRGKVIRRACTTDELASTENGRGSAAGRDLTALVGETACDVYLNEAAYWRNVPSKVWDFMIGGYPVMKKWLSYREREILGRALTMDEVRFFTAMARRITALVLLRPVLDENYAAISQASFAWSVRGSQV